MKRPRKDLMVIDYADLPGPHWFKEPQVECEVNVRSPTKTRLNLNAAWEQTTHTDREMGRSAYPVYQQTLRGLSDLYKTGFVATVEAFVALSPNNDYHGNLRSLVSLLVAYQQGKSFDNCVISTYRACGERAWGYLSGEVSFLDTVKGRKITSFRDNILYLEDSRRVTVDGHMIALGLADPHMTMSEANLALRQTGLYDDIERTVLGIARSSREAPCTIQAALWMWRKRTLGIKMNTQLDLFTGTTKWDGVIPADEIIPYEG